MSELLFECYNVPSVCYGIDSLFSFQQNNIGENGLILSFGYHTTHVIPILNGRVIVDKVRRINLGGFHMINYMHRLLQLKYPVHATAISLSRIEWLLHNHCSIAVDYMDELKKWSSYEYYEHNVKKIQLPYNVPIATTSTLSGNDYFLIQFNNFISKISHFLAEQKIEKKRELAKRLADINARKREEKLVEDEEQLERLLSAREIYNDGDMDEFEEALNNLQIPTSDELEVNLQVEFNWFSKILNLLILHRN